MKPCHVIVLDVIEQIALLNIYIRKIFINILQRDFVNSLFEKLKFLVIKYIKVIPTLTRTLKK